jgi:hypothetical protein
MKLAKMGPGYGLWLSTVSDAIDNSNEINIVIDAFFTVGDLSLKDFFKQHFYGLYDKTTSLPISGTPFGTITTVQSDAFPVEVEAIKKIFFSAQQALIQALATAPAVTLLQLPVDDEK